MDLSAVHDDLDRIIDSTEFKKGTYPILAEAEDKGSDIKGVSYQDILGYHSISFGSADGMKKLYDAYREDLSELTAADRRDSMPVIALQFRDSYIQDIADKLKSQDVFDYDQLSYVLYYPVYPTFKRTLGLLRDYGVTVNDNLSADDVNTIVISDCTGYELTEDGERKEPKADLIVSDKAQIAEILENARYSLNCSNALFPQFTDIDMNAHLATRRYISGTVDAAAENTAGSDSAADASEVGESGEASGTDESRVEIETASYDAYAGMNYGVKNLYLFFRADEVPDFLKDYFEISEDSIERCLGQTW